MPSEVLGGDRLVAHLRGDLSRVRSDLWIAGPWLDAWFAGIVIEAVPASVALRVLTRPKSSAGDGAAGNAAAIMVFRGHFHSIDVRLLDSLHGKALRMDDVIWVGSANWYRYSLERASEWVVRTEGVLEAFQDEFLDCWDRGLPSVSEPTPDLLPPEVNGEILDPLASSVLHDVPKTFVLGRRRK